MKRDEAEAMREYFSNLRETDLSRYLEVFAISETLARNLYYKDKFMRRVFSNLRRIKNTNKKTYQNFLKAALCAKKNHEKEEGNITSIDDYKRRMGHAN